MYNIWSALNQIGLNIGTIKISLADLIFAILFLIIILFFRYFLETIIKKTISNRFGIKQERGEAIAKISSYTLGSIIFLIALQTVGIDLSSLAVIGGGLGIGIGFGLQDLTKNFVSGLTIAFEDKIRKEDFIEIDNLKGFVEEILTRATIIRKLDGTRVIIPNSQLTEKSITNWSYSQIIFLRVEVGVAEGSNLDLVLEQLLQAAYEMPDILKDPPVKLLFKGFGDNSLNFEIWFSINDIKKMYSIQSDLYHQIAVNFAKYNIKIPFPQRSIWLENAKVLRSDYIAPISTLNKPQLIRDILKETTYFAHFTDVDLRRLVECGYSCEYPSQRVIFNEGDPGDSFYIILSGSVKIYTEKLTEEQSREEIELNVLHSGNFFGELSLLLNIPRTATVKTIEKTRLFVIPKTNFLKLLKSQLILADKIIEESKNHQQELESRRQELAQRKLISIEEIGKNILDWFKDRLMREITKEN